MTGIKAMRAHIEHLIYQYDISLAPGRDCKTARSAHCYPDMRIVRAPKIDSPTRYAVALHEIGHIFTFSATDDIITTERKAWAWARENAVIWTPAMERFAAAALERYHRWPPRRKR